MAAFADDMGTPNAPTMYYNTISQLGVTTNALYCTVAIVADALIVCPIHPHLNVSEGLTRFVQVYRLFVVWGYNYYIMIVPLLVFSAEIGTQRLL